MGEDGGMGRGGMKPIPSTKPGGKHDNNDDKKNNNQPMMVAVCRWGRMRWAIEGWASETREEGEDGGGGGAQQSQSPWLTS